MSTVLPVIEPIVGLGGASLDVGRYLGEDYADVADAAKELPVMIEWLNELRQACLEARDLAKIDLEKREAQVYFQLRGHGDDNFAANYSGKPTEDALKMAVALDPEVRRLKESSAAYGAKAARLSGTIASFQAKVELIRSSEATRRTAFDETSVRR
jgi:Tfp pilus assembly protein PilP